MDIQKEFSDGERVQKAIKELYRAIVWENTTFGGGEQEEVLDEVVQECANQSGETLIAFAFAFAHNAYLMKYVSKLIKEVEELRSVK